MDKFDRIQKLHRLFRSHRHPISLQQLAEELECTPRTVHRAIDQMRDLLDAPIEFDARRGGWHYDPQKRQLFELPGLWLTGEELQSLALLLHLLENVGRGLLADDLRIVERQIDALLNARGIGPGVFAEHVKVLPISNRRLPGRIFETVGEALLQRRRMQLRYTDYARRRSQRIVSPQTLVFYRDNWYLDAWCHRQRGLRTFSLARMDAVELTTEAAEPIARERLEEHFARSYGIFAGEPVDIATLRFLPEIAREIAMQQWHPEQQGRWDGDCYVLSFPYSRPEELVGDILRHVPYVIVEAPGSLREMVAERLREGVRLYE